MIRLTILLSLFLSCSIFLSAQKTAEEIEVIDLDYQSKILLNGNLEQGFIMPLKWAESSQVACFPGTRFYEFKGNHVLYRVQMPAGSNVKVTVTPKSKKTRINLYALRLGANNYDAPPEIFRAISCESSYPIYAGRPNIKAPAKPQSIEYMSIRKPYNILIGVAGAEGLTAADYELKIEFTER